jgi:protein TonB
MNILRYILPASIAAALHVVLVLGFNEKSDPVIRLVEVLLTPPPPKPPEDPDVPPEEKSSTTESVQPLGGGPMPPEIDPPPARLKADSIMEPAEERRRNISTDLKIVPTSFGPSDIGTGPGEWKAKMAGIGDLDHVPRAKVQIPPDYPAVLRQSGSSGSVMVEFDVDTAGRVVRAEAVRYTHREFAGPAVKAVLKWRFEPGLRHGRAVPFRMAIPIEFGLAAD